MKMGMHFSSDLFIEQHIRKKKIMYIGFISRQFAPKNSRDSQTYYFLKTFSIDPLYLQAYKNCPI